MTVVSFTKIIFSQLNTAKQEAILLLWVWQSIYAIKALKQIHPNFPLCIKKFHMLLYICSVIDHMWGQNMVRTKKRRRRCSLALSKHSVIKIEQNSKQSDRVTEEWKSGGDYSTVHYCAMFYLLNAQNKLGAVECVTGVLSIFWCPLWIITLQSHGNMESICFS